MPLLYRLSSVSQRRFLLLRPTIMQFFASELQGSKAMSEPNAEAIHSTFVKNVKAAGLVSKVENMLLIRVFRQGEGQMNRQIELEMLANFAGMTLVIHQVNFRGIRKTETHTEGGCEGFVTGIVQRGINPAQLPRGIVDEKRIAAIFIDDFEA